MSFKGIVKSIVKFIKILKLNYSVYKLSKRKNIIFKELGLIVYEFYHIDKTLIDDEEVLSLISEIKDIETEIDIIENEIEAVRNPETVEKEEIDNELLLNNSQEDTEEKEEKRQSEDS